MADVIPNQKKNTTSQYNTTQRTGPEKPGGHSQRERLLIFFRGCRCWCLLTNSLLRLLQPRDARLLSQWRAVKGCCQGQETHAEGAHGGKVEFRGQEVGCDGHLDGVGPELVDLPAGSDHHLDLSWKPKRRGSVEMYRRKSIVS
jgi:hypothetical protein